MHKRSKTKVQLYLLIGLVVLLLFVLIRSGDQEAKIRTLDERQVKQGEEFQKELDKRFDKLEKDILKLNSKVLSTTKTSQTAIPTPTTKQAVVYPIGCEKYRSEVAKYNWNTDIVLAVAYGESGCRSDAVSPTQDFGLLQINQVHAHRVNGDLTQLLNPKINIKVAYQIYSEQGWCPWTVARNLGCCK